MELLLVDTVKGHLWFTKFSGVIHGAHLDDYHVRHARGIAGERGATVPAELPLKGGWVTVFRWESGGMWQGSFYLLSQQIPSQWKIFQSLQFRFRDPTST